MKNTGQILSFSINPDKYNAILEKEANAIGMGIMKARKAADMSLSTLSYLLSTHGVSVTKASISKWETGITVPNAYQLFTVSRILGVKDLYRTFCTDYIPLLNEEGMAKIRAYERDLVATGLYSPVVESEEELIDMPWSYLRVSAGYGQPLDAGNFEMKSFPKSQVPVGADFCLSVHGDSMEPVFHDEQIVWVKETTELSVGDVGVFVYDGEGYLKVFNEKDPPKGDESFFDSFGRRYKQPILVSYNCKYDPIPILPGIPFKIVGKVLS